MAYGAGTNGIQGLVIPEVMADSVRIKLGKLVKFRQIAHIDTQLIGTVGNTVLVPSYQYIGDATDILEGDNVTGGAISMTTQSQEVKKAVKDVLVSDEAVLSTNGSVLGEVEYQLAVSIANKIDADALGALNGATNTIASVSVDQAGFATMATAFGEDLEGNTILFVHSADYGKILSMPEFVAVQLGTQFMSGHVGEILGVQIVVSDRISAGSAILVKTDADSEGFGTPLAIAYNRDVQVETFRDMSTRSTRIGIDCHYIAYIRNQASVRKIVAFA